MENDRVKFKNEFKRLRLNAKAVVYIDWANVYGWTKSLKREVDEEKLFVYLKIYPEIADIRLYFGLDTHPKSEAFLKEVSRIGYMVVQKPVKYIQVVELEGQKIYRRKCDFDMEVCIDAHRAIKEGYESFIPPPSRIPCGLAAGMNGDINPSRGVQYPVVKVGGFIFFTGDGDYEPLYKMLIGLYKQVIVVYTKGHLGKEIWAIKNGLFKAQLKNLMDI